MFNIILIEDCKEDIINAEFIINEWAYDKEVTFHNFATPELFKEYQKDKDFNQINLFILDIDLKGSSTNGISFAKHLRTSGYQNDILFLTAFKNFVFEGYDSRAINYLLKPVSNCKDKFISCINYSYGSNIDNTSPCAKMMAKHNVTFSDVIYFKANSHYIDVLSTKKEFSIITTLGEISEQMPSNFVRIHKSAIVNMRHIIRCNKTRILMDNDEHFKIGRAYKDDFHEVYGNYITSVYN